MPPRRLPPGRARVELAEIAEKVRRLTEAIEDGTGEVEALAAALKARQKRQRELQTALVELEAYCWVKRTRSR